MIVNQLNNPFLNTRVDDTVSIPSGDVPELHARVLEQCAVALQATRQSGAATSLLVIGEAGSGKSHMIAQLRKPIQNDPKAILVAVRLHGANSGRLWRHLRERMVAELLQKYSASTTGDNGLLRLLRNRFPAWLVAEDGNLILEWLIGKPNASDGLRRNLEEFARQTPEFDYRLRKVLPKLVDAEVSTLACDWLRGQQLADGDLKRLGLPPENPTETEQEQMARSVVLSFMQLAGDRTALFLFFDEVEAIQAGNYDATVLREFATLATELLTQPGVRVIATSIRPILQVAFVRAVEVSNVQKLTQFTAQIPALTWEQAIRITRCRLDGETTCRQARQLIAQGDPDWPLDREFLDRTFRENRLSLTPRHLIRACASEFQRLQKGSPQAATAVAAEVGAPAEIAALDELTRMWEKQRKKLLERPRSIQFDHVFALALPWLVNLTDMKLVRAKEPDHRLGDVNLVFHSTTRGTKAIGVSYCNHEPRQLWRRLDRLLKQWNAARRVVLAQLVLLRSSTELTRKGGMERLEQLRQAGVRLIHIDEQQLAELTAFQVMSTATLKGEMTRAGKPIDSNEYDTWTKANLSNAVKELLHQIFEPDIATTTSSPPLARKNQPARSKAIKS